MTYYKVKKGDTLSQIAGKANVKMSDIKRVKYQPIGNVNKLSVGEVLLLPNSKTNYMIYDEFPLRKTHTVKQGESLWLIASDNNMTVTELQKLNPQITNFDLIHPGDRIYLEG